MVGDQSEATLIHTNSIKAYALDLIIAGRLE
jgi:hypothetical protein